MNREAILVASSRQRTDSSSDSRTWRSLTKPWLASRLRGVSVSVAYQSVAKLDRTPENLSRCFLLSFSLSLSLFLSPFNLALYVFF